MDMNSKPPEISDQNQGYENLYFSMSYPKGWIIKEVNGHENLSSPSDGHDEMFDQMAQSIGDIATIYFFDPRYTKYGIIISVLNNVEATKNFMKDAEDGDDQELQRQYRDKGFASFSSSNNKVSIGGLPGSKQCFKASNEAGGFEIFNSILLESNDYIFHIVYRTNSNFSDKAVQRMEEIFNSFSKKSENYQVNKSEESVKDEQPDNNVTPAIADLTKAIELDPNNSVAYMRRGIEYSDQDNLTQAISDYTKAIEINSNFADAYAQRGGAYGQQGNLSQAISDLTKAIAINPNTVGAYSRRALAYYGNKEYDKAWDDVHKAEALGQPGIEEFLGKLKQASGRDQ